jgi:hypothetical protein
MSLNDDQTAKTIWDSRKLLELAEKIAITMFIQATEKLARSLIRLL